MGSSSKREQSLNQIFQVLEKSRSESKQNKANLEENEEMKQEQDVYEKLGETHQILNEEMLMEEVEREGLVIIKKDGDEEDHSRQVVKVANGFEAYFALLAQDMMGLADKYKRDVEEVHKIFFELSCDREKLIKFLEG
jgi:hypothetical protein